MKNETDEKCPFCKSQLGEHHTKDCRYWGQVLPSECPGAVERALIAVLLKTPKEGKQ